MEMKPNFVLDQMQVLDQQIALARALASSARTSSSAWGSIWRPLGVLGVCGRRGLAPLPPKLGGF